MVDCTLKDIGQRRCQNEYTGLIVVALGIRFAIVFAVTARILPKGIKI